MTFTTWFLIGVAIGVFIFVIQYILCQKSTKWYIKWIPIFVSILLSVGNLIYALSGGKDLWEEFASAMLGVHICPIIVGAVLAVVAYYANNAKNGKQWTIIVIVMTIIFFISLPWLLLLMIKVPLGSIGAVINRIGEAFSGCNIAYISSVALLDFLALLYVIVMKVIYPSNKNN